MPTLRHDQWVRLDLITPFMLYADPPRWLAQASRTADTNGPPSHLAQSWPTGVLLPTSGRSTSRRFLGQITPLRRPAIGAVIAGLILSRAGPHRTVTSEKTTSSILCRPASGDRHVVVPDAVAAVAVLGEVRIADPVGAEGGARVGVGGECDPACGRQGRSRRPRRRPC